MTRFPAFASSPMLPQMSSLQAPNPMAGLRSQPDRRRKRKRRRKTEPDPLSDEEANGLISAAMGMASGLGNAIDLPGSSVRDLLAGENPFDQWLSPLSGEDRTTGVDLLRKYNMADDEDTWGNFAGGLATEIATDPFLWATGPLGTMAKGSMVGAKAGLKATGKAGLSATDDAARAAGKVAGSVAHAPATGSLGDGVNQFMRNIKPGSRPVDFMPNTPASIADQIRRGERGWGGLRIPIVDKQVASFGAGSKAVPWLIDKVFYGDGALSKYVSAPARGVRHVMSHTAGGAGFDGTAQKALDIRAGEEMALLAGVDNIMPVMNEHRKKLLDEYTKIAKHHDKAGDQWAFGDFLRNASEDKSLLDTSKMVGRIQEALDLGHGPRAGLDSLANQTAEYVDSMVKIKDAAWQRVKDLGGADKDLEDMFVQHFGRRGNFMDVMAHGAGRDASLKDVPGGTVTLNRISRDPLLTALFKMKPKHLVGDAAKKWKGVYRDEVKGTIGDIKGWLKSRGDLDVVAIDSLKDAAARDAYLYRRYIEPEFRKATANGPVVVGTGDDAMAYTFEELQANWLQKTTSEAGKTIPSRNAQLRNYFGWRPKDTLEKGLFGNTEIQDWQNYMTSLLGQESTLRTARHMLTEEGVIKQGSHDGYVSLVSAWSNSGLASGGKNNKGLLSLVREAGLNPEEIGNLTIPEAMTTSLKAYVDATKPRTQKAVGPLLKQWDRMMALYRGSLTTPFPSFHIRNGISGVFQEMTAGKLDTGNIIAGKKAAIAYMSKGGREKQPLQYIDEIMSNGILEGHGELADIVGEAGAASAALHSDPGTWRGILSPLKRAGKLSNWNPVDMRGVRHHVDDVTAAAKRGEAFEPKLAFYAETGEKMYAATEFVLRAGYYEGLRKAGYSAAQAKHYVKQAHFDYSKLSHLEKQVARRGALFYCVPTDSQILTRRGWKNYNELQLGEDVLGYDVETQTQTWTTVENVAVFDYDGILMSISKQKTGSEWLFTADHRWPVRAYSTSSSGSKHKIVRGYQLRSNHAIPYTAPFDDWPKESLLTEREAAIVGWLITDGHISTNPKRRCTWCIYQSPKKFAQEIRELLGDDCLGESIHPDSGVIQFRLSKPLRERLQSLGFSGRKDAIDLVGKLNKASALAMWDAMYKADDPLKHPRNCRHFACEKQDVFDVAQMLIQLFGKRIHQSERGGYVASSRLWCKLSDPETIGTKHFKGQVWCPKTGTGTWVMRRNGKTIITGNTWKRKSVPYTLQVLAERPGGAKAQALRALNVATRGDGDGYMPQYLRERSTIPVAKGEDGQTTFMSQGGLPIEDLNMVALRGTPMKSVQRSLEGLLSQTNPVLSNLIQTMTGKELYSGRQLRDLGSRSERLTSLFSEDGKGTPHPKLDRALAMTPFSRAYGEGEKLLDLLQVRDSGRPMAMDAANFLTGAKFTTPDSERYKLIDALEGIREGLEEEPMVRESTRPYVPGYYKDRVSSDVLEQLQRMHELERLARKSKKR